MLHLNRTLIVSVLVSLFLSACQAVFLPVPVGELSSSPELAPDPHGLYRRAKHPGRAAV